MEYYINYLGCFSTSGSNGSRKLAGYLGNSGKTQWDGRGGRGGRGGRKGGREVGRKEGR